MIGEIGGPQEAEAAAWIKSHMTKPVVGYVAGLTARRAAAWAMPARSFQQVATAPPKKSEIMKSYGLTVAPSPSELGSTIAKVLAH